MYMKLHLSWSINGYIKFLVNISSRIALVLYYSLVPGSIVAAASWFLLMKIHFIII